MANRNPEYDVDAEMSEITYVAPTYKVVWVNDADDGLDYGDRFGDE